MKSVDKTSDFRLNLPKLKSYSQEQVSLKSGALSLKTITVSEDSPLNKSMMNLQ